MDWKIQEPFTVHWKLLKFKDSGFAKWGQLQYEHAERVQQRFAMDVLSVGTMEVVENCTAHDLPVYRSSSATDETLGQIRIWELSLAGKLYWALGPSCQVLMQPPEPILPPTVALELQQYALKEEFRKRCEAFHLHFRVRDGNGCFVHRKGGVSANWSPRVAATPAPRATSEGHPDTDSVLARPAADQEPTP